MTEVIVGTAGHIDHGKTALVKALTGVDADRLPEEKRRGITVDIGFADLSVGDVHIGFVDVPGHERFVKNMLAGASGIDTVLLVIAADDGVMPQTREHFDICRLLGVRSGVIAITKSDIVDKDTLELAKLDATELVAGSFLETAPVLDVSSLTGAGLEELKDALVRTTTERPANNLITRLPIDRSFSMRGFGTVITGTLASGEIAEGDELELLPTGRRLRVRGLQSHGRGVKRVNAGRRVAVNLAGIEHLDVGRGMMLAQPGVLWPTQMIDAAVEVLPDAGRPLRSRQRVRLHIGTAEILARVKVLKASGEIEPGEDGYVQLTLESPLAVVPGERLIIRRYSPQTTIAGGEVIDNAPGRHRIRDLSNVVAALAAKSATTKPSEKLRLLVHAVAKRGYSRADLAARTGYDATTLDAALNDLVADGSVIAAGNFLIAAAVFDELRSTATEAVEVFHRRQTLAKGMPREELREVAFCGVPESIFQAVVTSLAAVQKLVLDGDSVRLASFRNELSPDEIKVSDAILAAICGARLEVPKVDEVLSVASADTSVNAQQARRLMQLLLDAGKVVKVSDEFYFGRDAIDNLVVGLREAAASTGDRTVDVGRFKQLAGVSRKYAIPLLEYLDREKVTVRTADKRVIL